MNKKAFELTISTLVLMILGILILIALVLAVTGGLKKFQSSTEPFLDTARSTSIKQSCSLACDAQDKILYCCREYEIDNLMIKCSDSRLEINCNLDCSDFSCE